VGQVDDITPDQIVQKEILVVGEGHKRPKMNNLVIVSYKGYFFDHTEFD
jgi:FKBP-type peptidyl-prolyl cis-trans isomerase